MVISFHTGCINQGRSLHSQVNMVSINQNYPDGCEDTNKNEAIELNFSDNLYKNNISYVELNKVPPRKSSRAFSLVF